MRDIMATACLMCRAKDGDPTLMWNINRIESALARVRDVPRAMGMRQRLHWDCVSTRCLYGMSCPSLRAFRTRYESATSRIEEKLVTLAQMPERSEAEERAYRDAMSVCRMSFPTVYAELTRMERVAKE